MQHAVLYHALLLRHLTPVTSHLITRA